jgi:hypothetical protein
MIQSICVCIYSYKPKCTAHAAVYIHKPKLTGPKAILQPFMSSIIPAQNVMIHWFRVTRLYHHNSVIDLTVVTLNQLLKLCNVHRNNRDVPKVT